MIAAHSRTALSQYHLLQDIKDAMPGLPLIISYYFHKLGGLQLFLLAEWIFFQPAVRTVIVTPGHHRECKGGNAPLHKRS